MGKVANDSNHYKGTTAFYYLLINYCTNS